MFLLEGKIMKIFYLEALPAVSPADKCLYTKKIFSIIACKPITRNVATMPNKPVNSSL